MPVADLGRGFLKGKVSALGEGLSVRQISCKIGVPERNIRCWQSKNFRLQWRKITGRLQMTSIRKDRSIIRRPTVLNDFSLSFSEIAAATVVIISCKLIHHHLHKATLINRKRPSRLELTARHKEARMT